MNILNLTIENGRKITFIEIKPDGDVVKLVGKNEAGKSTILQAIKMALTGSKEKDFVKHGEEAAIINLKIGDDEVQYEIKQRVKADGSSTLVVKDKDGFKTTSPRKFLDDLIKSGLACDPAAFANMPKKERKKTLIQLLGIEDELFKIDAKEKELFDERAFANRELKKSVAVESEYEEMELEPVESVDVTELNEELQILFERGKQIQATKSTIENLEFRKEQAQEQNKARRQEIKRLKLAIQEGGDQIKSLDNEINVAKDSKILKDAGKIADEIEFYKSNITLAAERNKFAEKYQAWGIARDKREDIETEVAMFTETIKALRDQKTTLLTTAKMPLEGMAVSLEGDDIIYNDTAFDGLSDGAKLLVSLNMALAMTGKVKVALIKDASRLDIDNRKLIEQWAAEKGVQIWIEQPLIDENQEGILIEEGEVK